jgi:hypothetical protein
MLYYIIKGTEAREVLGYTYCWLDEGSTGIGEHPSFHN